MNTYNPYAPNPYINQPQQPDMGGLNPVFQNIGNQKAMLNQAIAQNQSLNQQASQIAGQSGAAMNNLAMAMLLRKGQSSDPYPYANAQDAMKKYGAENVYGYGGQGQVPTMTTGEN